MQSASAHRLLEFPRRLLNAPGHDPPFHAEQKVLGWFNSDPDLITGLLALSLSPLHFLSPFLGAEHITQLAQGITRSALAFDGLARRT
jgi:hypothetical protein